MAASLAEIADSFFTPAVNDLVPYEPGKPVEEVQRELGLERVVKLASNEGPFGPFPEAREAIERCAGELNRYPDGGAYRLRAALAERLDLRLEEVAPGAGSDGIVDGLSQAMLQPGDEIVCGWPSFPSYAIDARKLGAVARTVPLKDGRYDLDALLEAIGPRTKLVYICIPNNPTGTTNTRAEVDAYFERVPEHVVTVLDQAYFEYIDDPEYPDGIEEYLKARAARGRPAHVLEDLRPRRAAHRLRAGSRADRDRARQGAPRVRHHDTRAGGRAREPRLGRGARARRARERRGPRPPGGDASRSTASIRSARPTGTSSSPRSARTRDRSSSGSCTRA